MSRDDILARALDLPAAERRSLALELLDSVDELQNMRFAPDLEDAWYAEIQRRSRDIEAGTAKLIPWEQVRAELLADD
jgi:putative addiction module component (TIGR02574 family)